MIVRARVLDCTLVGVIMLADTIVYDKRYVGCFGVEQEMFLASSETGLLMPHSPAFLREMEREMNPERWTYELSACQVEYRTHPHADLHALEGDLFFGHEQGEACAARIDCAIRYTEVAPASMPLTVYDAEPRYARLVATLAPEVLLSACRVAGIHIHYGCESLPHAIVVYNRLVPQLPLLSDLGDHSKGERLRLYKDMAPVWEPPMYRSVSHFEEVATQQGFQNNLKKCWHLIRISRHGTVEIRVFGNTGDIGEIMGWVRAVRDIVRG